MNKQVTPIEKENFFYCCVKINSLKYVLGQDLQTNAPVHGPQVIHPRFPRPVIRYKQPTGANTFSIDEPLLMPTVDVVNWNNPEYGIEVESLENVYDDKEAALWQKDNDDRLRKECVCYAVLRHTIQWGHD